MLAIRHSGPLDVRKKDPHRMAEDKGKQEYSCEVAGRFLGERGIFLVDLSFELLGCSCPVNIPVGKRQGLPS